MEKKLDFLFTVECQATFLKGTATTLGIAAEGISHNLRMLQTVETGFIKQVLVYSDVMDTALRDLYRILETLDSAVEGYYLEKRNNADRSGRE